jgi:hypothetical protein
VLYYFFNSVNQFKNNCGISNLYLCETLGTGSDKWHGKIIPLFKDMFAELEIFLENLPKITPIKARLVIFALNVILAIN